MANHAHHHGNMDPEQQKAMMEQEIRLMKNMNNIKYKIAVMSGKGGVGKSTVAVNLATTFQKKGFKTGILDVDIHGPNVPKMLGLEGEQLTVDKNELIPVTDENGIKVLSMAFLLNSLDSPIIWRGPQKSGAIKQFMSDVRWGNLDVLIIDNPPGTGDEPLTVLQSLPEIDAVVMVTTPNSVSQEDVLKCVKMVKMLKVENIGLVENMAYFICPDCGKKIHIFGADNMEEFADFMEIKYLGDIPLTEEVSKSTEDNTPITIKNKESSVSKEFSKIVDEINTLFLKKEK